MNRARLKQQYVPFVVATLAAVAFLATSPAALAASKSWNSKDDPLVAWEGGARQALAHGTAYTKEGHLKNHTFYRDPRPGGDNVYTETDYSVYWPGGNGGAYIWQRCCKDQSSRSNSGLWRDQYDKYYYADVDGVDKGRVHYKVCEDQPWSWDPCSLNPFFTFAL